MAMPSSGFHRTLALKITNPPPTVFTLIHPDFFVLYRKKKRLLHSSSGFRRAGGSSRSPWVPRLHVHRFVHHLREGGSRYWEERFHHPAAHPDDAQRRHHSPHPRLDGLHHGGTGKRRRRRRIQMCVSCVYTVDPGMTCCG